ncbi:hypothetical protein [Stieleria neptunia]|nr:hypothetical protein [Stieleria neptunia]
MPHSTQQKVIEFLGGPLDGHLEPLAVTAERLPEKIVCYISANVFHLLEGEPHEHENVVTSLVIYRRENQKSKWSYAFAGSFAPRDVTRESTDEHRKDGPDDESRPE